MIERWRDGWLGRHVDGFVPVARAHEHYCAAHDHRWRCELSPCRQGDIARCPVDYPPTDGCLMP